MKKYTNHRFVRGFLLFLFFAVSVGAFIVSVQAQSSRIQKPVVFSQVPNKIIRLTPNESKILHLSRNASSVVVANPVHASVFLDTPRLLVIVPGAPGATSFVILDRDGQEIMRQDIIVSGRKNKYVRIQRVCSEAVEGCVPSSIYYCPDGCHQVSVASSSAGTSGISVGSVAPSGIEEGEE